MKSLIALLSTCILLTACLSATDATSLGFEQGLNGSPYSRIGGDYSQEHRDAWVEGNAQYCRTLSYTALARSLGSLPIGVCDFSDAQLRSYCRSVDYAAFGRADQDIPTVCTPSTTQSALYQEARIGAFCTTSQGQRDLRSRIEGLWSWGSCDASSSERTCERSTSLLNAGRDYCSGVAAYEAGAEVAFFRAQSDAVRDASAELAQLSALENPTTEQLKARERLIAY